MNLTDQSKDDPSPQDHRQATANPHPNYGINAKRGCTDCGCFILHIIFWAVCIFVAVVAYKNGDPNRALYGIDYLGNNCGHGDPDLTDLLPNRWSTRLNIWYPLQFPSPAAASVESTKSIGVCVTECPKAGSILKGYAKSGTPFYQIPYYVVLYDSFPVLHRCVLNVSSFLCNSLAECESVGNGVAPTPAPPGTNRTQEFSFHDGISSLRSMVDNNTAELLSKWWVIVVCSVISVLLSFLWMFVLRRLVKPIVVLTGILLLALFAVGGGVCYMMYNDAKDASLGAPSDAVDYWLAGAIVIWVAGGILLLVIVYLMKDIMTACDIIEEASKVPIKLPSMALVPIVSFVFCLPLLMFTLMLIVFIETCGEINLSFIPGNITVPGLNVSTNVLAQAQLDLATWRIPAHLYNLFMFLWSIGVVNAAGFMILSMCAVFWYFSEPGDHKSPPLGSVMIATCLVLKNHLGTIMFGAFLVALVQILRVILLVFEKKIEEIAGKQEAVKAMMACVQCILACLERLLKFINKNAYIMTAIEGTSFIDSAMKALSLLVANALTVGAITIISEYVMIFGKLLITAATTLIGFAILRAFKADENGANDDSEVVRSGVLLLAIIAVFAYLSSAMFANILGVCIDTILLCFCLDKADGSATDYFPSDLERYVVAQGKKNGAPPMNLQNGKEEPMLRKPEDIEML